jgi:hypothetical protein
MINDLPYWSTFNFNNTYKPLIDEATWSEAQMNFLASGGCKEAIMNCREQVDSLDPDGHGTNDEVNTACREATGLCLKSVGNTFPPESNIFDISGEVDSNTGLSACLWYLPVFHYLNQPWIQQALGVPLNFTYISAAVLESYTLNIDHDEEFVMKGTGDVARASSIPHLEYLLNQPEPVKVALVFGDLDARCPWIAGEAVIPKLALPTGMNDAWESAGFEVVQGSDNSPISGDGAVVKQVGPLSFSRVFQAGHTISAYQPQMVYEIFKRVATGVDVATGEKKVQSSGQRRQWYTTSGPHSSVSMYNGSLLEPATTCVVNGRRQEESVWEPFFLQLLR